MPASPLRKNSVDLGEGVGGPRVSLWVVIGAHTALIPQLAGWCEALLLVDAESPGVEEPVAPVSRAWGGSATPLMVDLPVNPCA